MNTDEKITGFLKFLADRQAETLQEAEQLAASDRKDESSFFKAKANIYDVFASIAKVAQKQSGQDADRFRSFFLSRAETIPAEWKKSLQAAREHNDARKAVIEEHKLAAVDEIVEMFRNMFEGSN